MSQENDAEYHVNTDELLAELQAEGNEIDGKEPAKEPEPTVPSQPEEPEVPETSEEPIEEPTVIDRVPKEPTLIPAWKAKIAEDRLAKENEELKKQIEAFQTAPTQAQRDNVQTSIENIRALAEEEGLQLDERQERFFNKMATALAQKAVPQDIVKNMEAFQQQQQITYLEQQYESEFTRDVAPLIREQYGEVSDKELATLSKKLHDIAFTDAYAKVPLKKIFRAEADDIGWKPSVNVVTHKSGRTRNAEIDISNIDDETFSSLSGDELDSFIEKKTAGTGKWSRR